MDLIGRIRWLGDNGHILNFDHYENDVLKNNLMMIDTILPDIIQRMLLLFYKTDARTVNDLIKEIEAENFMNFNLTDYPLFYKRKVANMLVDAALGMVPKTRWHGKYEATGGYLIVKEDGEIVCYHFYERNLFEDYLLNNTDFTTPGKHEQNNFGLVYKRGFFLARLLFLLLRARASGTAVGLCISCRPHTVVWGYRESAQLGPGCYYRPHTFHLRPLTFDL